MSELISSRTWRPFSGAAVTHAATALRLARSNSAAATSARVRWLGDCLGETEAGVQAIGGAAACSPSSVPAQIHADLDQASRVLGAFEIPRDSVEAIGDA